MRGKLDTFSKRVLGEALASKASQMSSETARLVAPHSRAARGQAYKARSSVASPTFQAAGAFAGTASGMTVPFPSGRSHRCDFQRGGSSISNSSPGGLPYRRSSYGQVPATLDHPQVVPMSGNGGHLGRPQYQNFMPYSSYSTDDQAR